MKNLKSEFNENVEKIVIRSDCHHNDDLLIQLNGMQELVNMGFQFGIEKKLFSLRGVDPTIIVASVGAVGVTLAALVSGILNLAKKSNLTEIKIKGTEGGEIVELTVPLNCPPDHLKEILSVWEKLHSKKIHLI